MRKFVGFLAVILVMSSCKKDDLSAEFDCGNSKSNYELKEYRDVLKKFRVEIPKSWKTQLYYDDFQSQLYSADTTKSISETYILDISWHQGELILNKEFSETVKDTLAIAEKLTMLKSSFGDFKEKPMFWSLSKGKQGNYDLNSLQLYIKTEPDEYFTITTKVFGSENVNDRLCESINFAQKMTFIE